MKRLDGLEQLIRSGKSEDSTLIAGGSLSRESPSDLNIIHSPSKAQYPAPRHLADTAEYRYHVNVESMLQWPVFDDQNIDQRANLKCLFHPIGEEHRELQWSPSDPDLQTEEVDKALRSFFDHVHIFNPIFEEVNLTEQLRYVRLNGLGWNPESCLIVCNALGHFFIPLLILVALDVCRRTCFLLASHGSSRVFDGFPPLGNL